VTTDKVTTGGNTSLLLLILVVFLLAFVLVLAYTLFAIRPANE
jgi:hypothetical protein